MAGIERYINLSAYGLQAKDFPENLAGSYEGKRCLVVGGGRCVYDDLLALGVLPGIDNSGWDVMCVNDIIMHYPGSIEHAYSNDDKWLPRWLAARRQLLTRRLGNAKHVHTCRNRNSDGYNFWPWPGFGTSGLGATFTALGLGYDNVVLCGVPLDNSGHYFEAAWIDSNFTNEVPYKYGEMRFWKKAADDVFAGRVTSMSGRTKELLGAP